MAVKASEYVKVLQGWVGKNEKDGSHKDIIDLYNKCRPLPRNYMVTYKDSWCATTLGAAAVACGDTIMFPIECSCGKVIEKAKEMGIWVENENRVPNVGDWCVYDWDDKANNFKVTDNTGWPEHIGAVESVAGNKFVVIEGNKNDAVGRRELEVNGRYIRGFVVPKYAPETISKHTSVEAIAKDVIAGKYGNGHDTRRALVEAEGFNYDEVRAKVNELLKASSKESTQNHYYPKYMGKSTSLDVMLKEIGVPDKYRGSWTKRKPLAEKNGISNYKGTDVQNIQFKKLITNGKLLKM